MSENSSQGLSAAADFYRRRDKWIDWCLERDDLNPTTRVVGLWMARRMNVETLDTWYQMSTMAAKLGMKTRTIIRAVQALEEAEMIVVRRDGRRGLKKAVNRYELVFPWGEGDKIDTL
jgi:DNA-binding MarR family transcriptional regulator